MTDLIRSACLTHYPELAALGRASNPLAMLRKVRLPLSCLARQNMRIAVRQGSPPARIDRDEAGVESSGCAWPNAAASPIWARWR